MRATISAFAIFGLISSWGCGGDDSSDVDASSTIDGTAGADAPPGADAATGECVPDTVPCLDDMLLDLSLHDDKVSTGDIENTADGANWVSVVDATAGGYNEAANNPFLYMRFEETGLVKVELDDDTALSSKNWDIAARRFIVRLNGGNSGPACTGADARTETTYPFLSSIPLDAEYSYDDFYTAPPDCTLIDDGSGLGSPGVALASWWVYTSCVATTETPFLIQLESGRVVKLVIEAYYESGQEGCNNDGTMGTTSGMLRLRWAFMS